MPTQQEVAAYYYHNPQGGVSYSNRDTFETERAAGSVDGTDSEPGPGVREVVDTGSKISISGGKLVVSGGTGTWTQTGWYMTPAFTRAAGKAVLMDIRSSGFNTQQFGISSATDHNFTGFNNGGITISATDFSARRTTNGNSPVIFTPSTNTDYRVAFVLRNNGRFIFIRVGSTWKLLWLDTWDNTATLYIAATHLSASAQMSYDNIASPDNRLYEVVALASDSFDRANGALGNTDGAGHAEASSGDGVAWVNDIGTTEIATNVAQASALSGGIAIATVDTGNADVLAMANLTRSAGNVGIVTRYVDASNYVYTYHDGTNVITVKVVAGTPTTVHTTAATYSASARLMVIADGTAFRIYYNELRVAAATISDAALQSGTRCGLYSSNTGNTHNNFVCFARNGYADLDDY